MVETANVFLLLFSSFLVFFAAVIEELQSSLDDKARALIDMKQTTDEQKCRIDELTKRQNEPFPPTGRVNGVVYGQEETATHMY